MKARYRAGKRLWNPDDDERLRRRYPDTPTAKLAKQLRRSLTSVYARAGILGLTKSEAYLAGPHACRLRRGDNVGAAFRFRPGQTPANKGLRRPGWAPGRMAETQFKPGHRSRWMPVGSTRLCDGYVYRKIADTPKVPWTRNWKLDHFLVWERAHGPVPAGHALAFKNGNRLDVRLENLECITRRELIQERILTALKEATEAVSPGELAKALRCDRAKLRYHLKPLIASGQVHASGTTGNRRNTVHNMPKPIAQSIQLLGALNRQIRRRTRGSEEQNQRPA